MTLLEAERRARGWSQTDLAFHSRTTQGKISTFERRQAVPRPSQAERLALVLGVRVDVLLREVGGPEESAEAGGRG